MNKILKIIAVTLSALLFLTACSNNNKNSSDSIKIVTSINFYAEVAKNIVQDKAEVVSIIANSNIDPHDFEPTAEDAKKVADANIVILNGGGYDSWFEKLAKSNKDAKTLNAAELIKLKDGENEHIWYNPQVLKNVANSLTDELIKKDAKNKEFYEKNRDSYISELNKIDDKIKSLKEQSEGQYVLTTEPVFNYAIEQLGFKTSEAVDNLAKNTEEGVDPAPKDLKQIQQDITDKKIKLIVNNIQTTNKAIEGILHLAEENNIPVLNVSETQPNGKTYVQWMLDQYEKLEKILNGGSGEAAYHNADA